MPARKNVACSNPDCEFMSQRKATGATDQPCPRCSSAVQLVVVEVREKGPRRAFIGVPLVDLRSVRVSLMTNQALLAKAGRAGSTDKVAGEILDQWAAKQ